MPRDKDETVYRICVEDIYLTAESFGRDQSELTDDVVERVIHKIEAMDFSDMAQTIDMFTDDAIGEIKEAKSEKIVEHPWGTRRKGGWVIEVKSLLESLKKGQSVRLDKVTVGTKPLIELLRLFPTEYCLIKSNGRLEIETIEFKRGGYHRPKHYHNFFGLQDGAWLDPRKPIMKLNPVILRPKKIG